MLEKILKKIRQGVRVAGIYLIVEDSYVNGNPTYEDFGPGPMESIVKLLASHPEFRSDRSREKYWLTYNPKGYLLKT